MFELPGRPHFSIVVAAQARHTARYWALTLLTGASSEELKGATGGGSPLDSLPASLISILLDIRNDEEEKHVL